MTDPPRRDKEWQKVSERIFSLTLEIIYLLTGEDYTVVKKTSADHMTPKSNPFGSGVWTRSQSPIKELPPHCLIFERNNKKILEVTRETIELLTGEVPIWCQDVSFYFSIEEWEYIEGHKDLYKDVMMENRPPLTPTDGSSNRSTPERCPSPFYSWDSPQEHLNFPEDYEVEELIITRVEDIDEEEICMGDNDPCEEDNPPEISTGE
ncbi:gastrula zinc finger protein XlCGF66.1-like [Aquarana catesbeiana]|uniref:gastrula zinc finger protein XlCGF66.1-like n=1 Tax=Aquarana catesbeiana TaxID=8400 RepID=UPI003CCA2972